MAYFETTDNLGLRITVPGSSTDTFRWYQTSSIGTGVMHLFHNFNNILDPADIGNRLTALETSNSYAANVYAGTYSSSWGDVGDTGTEHNFTINTGSVFDPYMIIFIPAYASEYSGTGQRYNLQTGLWWFKNRGTRYNVDFSTDDNQSYSGLKIELTPITTGIQGRAQIKISNTVQTPRHLLLADDKFFNYIVIGKGKSATEEVANNEHDN